ncbi:MAG: hypothetical protein WCH34_07705 [Bacteroidota bacterium]
MKHFIFSLLISLVFILPLKQAYSQKTLVDSAAFVTLIYATYQYQFPGGDMVNRFGSNSNIGGGVSFKTKSNWIFGLEGGYIFGDVVKGGDHLFSGISTSDGNVIDGNGIFAEIHLYERAYHFQLKAGKVFPILGSNPNSGLLIMAGAGFLEHKIRIENPDNTAPQIKDDYKKGYDKLSNGLMFNETIGYLYMGKRRLTNFFIGLEFMQAFTKSRRSYDFNLMGKDNTNRTDLLSGFRVSWIIPLYDRGQTHYYIN